MSLFRRRRGQVESPRGAALAEGWNGIPWGASLDTFKAAFSGANLTEAGWWHTGLGPEPFCGVPMAITQYAFNGRGQLSTVAFIPEAENRPHLSVAAVNNLGPPDGMDLVWTFGDVVVEVKLAGVVATLNHRTYSDV